jgi:hypothetical protein
MLEQVAELVRRDDPQIDPDARVGAELDAGLGRRAGVLDEVEAGRCSGERHRVGGGGDHVQVLDRIGHPPGGSGQLNVGRRGVLAERGDERIGDRERAVEHDPGGPLAGAG